MNKSIKLCFKAHRPNFIDSDQEIAKLDFDTLEELLEFESVKNFSGLPDFSGYALSKHAVPWTPVNHCIMATYKNGAKWWVVGYVGEGGEHLGLPEWQSGVAGYMPPEKGM